MQRNPHFKHDLKRIVFAFLLFSSVIAVILGGNLVWTVASLMVQEFFRVADRPRTWHTPLPTPIPPTAASVATRVNEMRQLADGKILVAGQFTHVDDIPRNHIARLNNDGSLDPSFDPGTGADAMVEDIVVQPDGKIIIVGEFASFNNQARSRVARLEADGTLDASFVPPEIEGRVWEALLQPDGKLLIAGRFVHVDGQIRMGIARLHPDGSFDERFNAHIAHTDPHSNNFVAGLAIQPDGKILIGGRFDLSIENQAFVHFARLNPDGSLDRSAEPIYFGDTLREIALQPDGKILVSGRFHQVNDHRRSYVARLNHDLSLDLSFQPNPGPDQVVVSIVALPDGKVLIGGEFTQVNQQPQRSVARLLADGQLDYSFHPFYNIDGAVYYVLPLDDGHSLIGGLFNSIESHRSLGLARLQSDAQADPTFRANIVYTSE
ncbi:MAG: hypothetical protein EI684_15585 [Candidatus Viridilinea halotolerans]|uniref:Delta-60 repeat domain-containing protein n=1 Tax=Candidatus Viridilinea halotolerans TaxID=2491704 RepID=A0A426TVI4_9CHLR|nr:MAG: hypothetical protein EI684_15585 [Candidatus Viridilinea halotolerans]